MIRTVLKGAAVGVVCVAVLLAGSGEAKGMLRSMVGQRLEEVTLQECYEPSLSHNITKDKFPYCSILEPGTIALYWTHDYTPDRALKDSNLTMAVVAKTTHDWVAIGLSRHAQGMAGMDVAMHRKEAESGGYVLEDRFAIGYDTPELDEQQDKTLLFSEVHSDAGLTIFAFTMTLEPRCEDVHLDPRKWTHVMWAMGDNSEAGEPAFHNEDHGAVKLPLLGTKEHIEQESKRVEIPSDHKTLTLQLPEMVIPPGTTYMCLCIQPPKDRKYHLYGAELLEDKDVARRYVHHTAVYSLVGRNPYPVDKPFDCGADLPIGRGLVLVVATGTSLSSMPSPQVIQKIDAALPFGQGYGEFWVLEAHLNNPQNDTGHSISPGFSFTYSPTLRTHDLGLLLTGAAPTIPEQNFTSPLQIPPGMQRYDYLDYCPSTCTQRFLPPDGAHIIWSMIHMHMAATQGEVQLVRKPLPKSNVSEVVTLVNNPYYDFNNQEGEEWFTPGVPFRPGDRIITRCTYTSAGKSEVIPWSESTQGEMCMGAILYYPAKDLAACNDIRDAWEPSLDSMRAANHGMSVPVANCDVGPAAPDSPMYDDRAVPIPNDEMGVKTRWRELSPEDASFTCSADAQ